MAKFCNMCGKQLEEGKVCECKSNSEVAAAVETPPIQQNVNQVEYKVEHAPVGIYFSRVFSLLKSIVLAPATIGRTFVANNDISAAFGVIIFNAICTALFVISVFKNFGSLIEKAGNTLGGLLGSGSFGSSLLFEFPYGTIFIEVLIMAIGISALFGLALLFFNKVMFKKETNYKAMICAVAAGNVPIAFLSLISALLCFISIQLGGVLFGYGVLLSYFYTFTALKSGSDIDDDKLVYVAFLGFVTVNIVTGIVIYFIYPTFLPEMVRNSLDYMKEYKY